MKSLTRITIFLTVSGVLVLPIVYYPKRSNSGARPPVTPEGRMEDIEVFRNEFLSQEVSYSAEARAEAERRLAVLEGKIDTIGEPEFELELARIVALADNGHTHYVSNSISRYYNRVPIRLGVFGEDFYVLRAMESDTDLLGTRLVAIDGHSINSLRNATRQLWGGLNAWRDRFAFDFLESPELLNAMNLAAVSTAAVYLFETQDGVEIERKLIGEAPGTTRPFSTPAQNMFPERLPLEDSRFSTALALDKAPWSLRDSPIPFRWRKDEATQSVVIEFRRNVDGNGFRIKDALKAFETAIRAEKPVNLVVDMRVNDGGDLTTTRTFMESLGELVPGRVFLLTSPLTFSAAISSVAYAKQAAPEKVTIVGETVGDRLMFFAEGDGIDLPNTRAMIGPSRKRHDYVGGCRDYDDCERAVVRNRISVASLEPDISAPWTIEAYLAGLDPGMDAIAAALRKGQ